MLQVYIFCSVSSFQLVTVLFLLLDKWRLKSVLSFRGWSCCVHSGCFYLGRVKQFKPTKSHCSSTYLPLSFLLSFYFTVQYVATIPMDWKIGISKFQIKRRNSASHPAQLHTTTKDGRGCVRMRRSQVYTVFFFFLLELGYCWKGSFSRACCHCRKQPILLICSS